MTPGQVRRLADRIDKHARALAAAIAKVPGEAYRICGHEIVADADQTVNAHRLAARLRNNAGAFGSVRG